MRGFGVLAGFFILVLGAFVTGGPHGSGPAAAAPLLRRGRELRSELILRVFAVDRFLRFLILGAAAYGVWRFKYTDRAGIQRAFDNALPAIRALYRDLGFNISHSKLLPFIQHSFTHTSRWLTFLAIGLAVYALIELVESVGLWLGKRWGEYFALVATSIFLPYEVYELNAKITWPRVAAARDQPAARDLPGLDEAAVRHPRRQESSWGLAAWGSRETWSGSWCGWSRAGVAGDRCAARAPGRRRDRFQGGRRGQCCPAGSSVSGVISRVAGGCGWMMPGCCP